MSASIFISRSWFNTLAGMARSYALNLFDCHRFREKYGLWLWPHCVLNLLRKLASAANPGISRCRKAFIPQ